MKPSRALALGIVGWGALLAKTLLAATPIEWEAPEGCPSTQVVYEELQRALGRDAEDLGNLSRVRGTIVADPAGYRLTLEVSEAGRRSLRSIHAEQCRDLAHAAALAIALAVHAASDSSPGAGTSARAVADVGAPSAQPGPVEHDGDAGAGARGEPATLWWSAGANAVLDVGALPDPQLGLGVAARARLAAFELDVHGLLLPTQALGVGNGESVDLGLMAAGLRACLRWLEQRLVAGACLGAEAGRFSARGIGLEPTREALDLWLAVGPAVLARTSFAGPLQLELLAEPLLPLARKQYAVNATEVVHSPAVVDVRFQLGLIISELDDGVAR